MAKKNYGKQYLLTIDHRDLDNIIYRVQQAFFDKLGKKISSIDSYNIISRNPEFIQGEWCQCDFIGRKGRWDEVYLIQTFPSNSQNN